MAAPSSTQWGTVRGSENKQGRIGINVTTSDSATQRTVTIAIWLWTRYKCEDSGNTFKYGWSGTPTTTIGSKNINTTSNSSWSTTNQVLIGTYNKTYTKGTSATSGSASASYTSIEYGGGSGSKAVSFSIPALASYSITYNANGGSGAPGKQTKWYGKNITFSSTKPTRTGYSFQGSATSASGGVSYAPGASYTGNGNLTLYAVWKANTYTVSYNANGGSGAPGNQTKTYGVNLTLSSVKPTRTNYNFKGWGTSAGSTTVAYAAGATYTENAAITLYAIWELAYVAPRIANFTADRCNSAGTVIDEGSYALVKFAWQTDKAVTGIKIEFKAENAEAWSSVTVSASGTSGNVSKVVGGSLSMEYAYHIRVTVTDSNGSSNSLRPIAAKNYIIDLKKGGKGISFGKPAVNDGFEVALPAVFEKTTSFKADITDKYGMEIGNGIVKYSSSGIDPDTTLDHAILTHLKTPMGANQYMYIITYFYGSKSTTAHRMQMAFPYNGAGSEYHRYFANGAWTAWRRHVNDDEITDTGWVECGLGNGIVSYGSGYAPRVRRIGKQVMFVGKVKNNTSWNIHDNIFTIPSGFRPSIERETQQKATGFCSYKLTVRTNGVCQADCVIDGKGGTGVKLAVGSFYSIADTWFI